MRALALLLVGLLLAGCGLHHSAAEAKAPAPAATPTPKVSVAAICQLLQHGESTSTSPLNGMVKFIRKPQKYEQAHVDEARSYIGDLRDISHRAPADLEAQIGTFTDSAQKLVDVLTNGGSWSAGDLKAAGYDINETCGPYYS